LKRLLLLPQIFDDRSQDVNQPSQLSRNSADYADRLYKDQVPKIFFLYLPPSFPQSRSISYPIRNPPPKVRPFRAYLYESAPFSPLAAYNFPHLEVSSIPRSPTPKDKTPDTDYASETPFRPRPPPSKSFHAARRLSPLPQSSFALHTLLSRHLHSFRHSPCSLSLFFETPLSQMRQRPAFRSIPLPPLTLPQTAPHHTSSGLTAGFLSRASLAGTKNRFHRSPSYFLRHLSRPPRPSQKSFLKRIDVVFFPITDDRLEPHLAGELRFSPNSLKV